MYNAPWIYILCFLIHRLVGNLWVTTLCATFLRLFCNLNCYFQHFHSGTWLRAENLKPSLLTFQSVSLRFLRGCLFLGQCTKTVLQFDKVQTPSSCKASALLKWPWTGHWIPTSSGNTALCSAMQSYLDVCEKRDDAHSRNQCAAMSSHISPGIKGILCIYLSCWLVIYRWSNITTKTRSCGHTACRQTSNLAILLKPHILEVKLTAKENYSKYSRYRGSCEWSRLVIHFNIYLNLLF